MDAIDGRVRLAIYRDFARGVVPTFVSWLEDPSSGAAQLDPATNAFAAAAAESLARLGGSYARLVRPEQSRPCALIPPQR